MIDLTPFIKYVTDCKNFIKYNREIIIADHPYISICIAAKNMQDYIERNLLSIINQSFQNFEIIIVNDGSDDETENIINRIQSTDKRIKLLSHSKSLGVYRSRIEAISNSKSEYTLIMDPDDMYLNENLFRELYNYNQKYNLDIIISYFFRNYILQIIIIILMQVLFFNQNYLTFYIIYPGQNYIVELYVEIFGIK